MPRLYADNAVLAKIKALYGKRLTEDDYRQLLSKKSVGEVAGYLKRETSYASSLEEVKEELIHRGQLENLLHRHLLGTYMRLMRYTRKNDAFSRLFASENEITQLLTIIRMLNAGTMEKYISSFPAYLSGYLSFDLFSAAKVKTYDELLALVEHSAYYGILGRYRPISAGEYINIPGIETALLTHFYTAALELVRERYGGDTRHGLTDMLLTRIDMHNLQVIYRMKRYFNSPSTEIRACLIPIKSHIPAATFASLTEAADASAVLVMLKNVQLLRRFLSGENQDIEHIIQSIFKYRSEKLFRFSIKPAVVVMSYMVLQQIELSNIINIIEGIRYATPAEEIRRLLV